MRIQHGRCPRVGFSRDRCFSHHRVTRDVTGPCTAKIQCCLPGRHWHWRPRSELRSVLNERRWGTGRKRREDRNDRSERDEWARQWPRPDRDHGCKTMTTDDVPTAYRHTPPPNEPKFASRSRQNRGRNQSSKGPVTELLRCDGFATPGCSA